MIVNCSYCEKAVYVNAIYGNLWCSEGCREKWEANDKRIRERELESRRIDHERDEAVDRKVWDDSPSRWEEDR